MVYIPVDSDQVLSSSRQTQEYDPQEAFAPDFVPVVQGRRAVKKQTEPNFHVKVSKMGLNLTSMRQVLHSHHSGNLPPPPPPTGAKALPPPVMNDRGQIIGPTLQQTDLSTNRMVFGPIHVF